MSTKKSIAHTWSIDGEMTIYTAAALKQTLVSKLESNSELTIDLSQISEIDSAGLQLLLLAQREAAKASKAVHFSQPNAAVSDVLSLYQYDLPNREKTS